MELAYTIQKLVSDLNTSINSYDPDQIEKANVPLNKLREDVRETIQSLLRPSIEPLINKLQKNEALTSHDMELIQQWVIGDAEYYAKIENNMLDWVAECKRLIQVLSYYSNESRMLDEKQLFTLGAILTDLKYTLTDILRYTEARQRVDKFKQTIGAGQLTLENKRLLADMMERQLISEEF